MSMMILKRGIWLIIVLSVLAGCSNGTDTLPQMQNAEPAKDTKLLQIPLPNPSSVALSIGISAENYPRIDGSTSTLPLVQGIYRWMLTDNEQGWLSKLPPAYRRLITSGVTGWKGFPQKASKTMPSYEMLINGDVDLIIVPDPSEEIIKMAADSGIMLEYVPIGAEALVFITHKDNPVDEITSEQVQKIYSDMTITDWSVLGGLEGRIIPICRNADSGSQAQMESRVMKDKKINPSIEENYMERDMNGMVQMVEEYKYFAGEGEENAYALGYTMYYFLNASQSVMGEIFVKTLAYDGVSPTPETLLSKEYPLASNYFAVIRKDTPDNHPARRIAHWLTGDEGQWAVVAAGLGALKPVYELP